MHLDRVIAGAIVSVSCALMVSTSCEAARHRRVPATDADRLDATLTGCFDL
jgi:hypothetical protein